MNDPHPPAHSPDPERKARMERYDPIDPFRAEFSGANAQIDDPVLALRGLGREIWENENADEYVRGQRADW